MLNLVTYTPQPILHRLHRKAVWSAHDCSMSRLLDKMEALMSPVESRLDLKCSQSRPSKQDFTSALASAQTINLQGTLRPDP